MEVNEQKKMFLLADVCMYGQKDDGGQRDAQYIVELKLSLLLS